MKKWVLLCCIFLLKVESFGFSAVASFADYGKIEIDQISQGIRITTNLQLEPHQRYMVKLLSSCKIVTPYWIQFRYSFSVNATSNEKGVISGSSIFWGMRGRDLISRNLDTIALLNLQKSHWKMIGCAPIQMLDTSHPENPNPFQP